MSEKSASEAPPPPVSSTRIANAEDQQQPRVTESVTEKSSELLPELLPEPPASETLDVEKVTSRLTRMIANGEGAKQTLRNIAAKGSRFNLEESLAVLDEQNDFFLVLAAALPSLLQAQADLAESLAQNQRERERTIAEDRRANEAQTERDAALKRIKGFQALVKLHIRDNEKLAAEREELRSQVSALEAAQREIVAKAKALPMRSPMPTAREIVNGGGIDYQVSRRAVLALLTSDPLPSTLEAKP